MAELSPEAHARLIWCLMVILYSVFALRCWALRKVKYSFKSPRGISSLCIIATITVVSILAGMVTWSLVGPYAGVADKVLAEQEVGLNANATANQLDPFLSPSSTVLETTILKDTSPTPSGINTGTAPLIVTNALPTTAASTATKAQTTADPTSTKSEAKSTATETSAPTEVGGFTFKSVEELAAMSPTDFEAYKSSLSEEEWEVFKDLPQSSAQGFIGDEVPEGAQIVDVSAGSLPEGDIDISSMTPEQLKAAGIVLEGPAKRALIKRFAAHLLQKRQKQEYTQEEADRIAQAYIDAPDDAPTPEGFSLDPSTPIGEDSEISDIDTSKLDAGDVTAQTFFIDTENIPQFETLFKVNFASMAVFYTALWLAKASFLVFYFEFSSSLTPRTRRLLYASSIAMVATYGFTMLVHLMWCLPIEDNWRLNAVLQIRTCRAEIAPSVIAAVINVLTDLLLACTFFAIIRSIKRAARNDFRAASLILFTGCLTILVAIIRLGALCALMTSENKRINAAADTGVTGANQISRAIRESVDGYPEVEAILAAMATCLPALRALFRQSTGKSMFGSTKNNTQMTAPPTYHSEVGGTVGNRGFTELNDKDLERGAPMSSFKFS